tara:strand:+ start:25 stop:558 length:534 start_codon:yes stop_codon:yes gene_type:complete
MTYKISGATALSLLTTVATIGCLDILKVNPMVGDWAMTSLEDNCKDLDDMELCFNLSEFSFTAAEGDDGLSVDPFDIDGDLVMSYSYEGETEEYTYNFTAADAMELEVESEEDSTYTISTGVVIDLDGEEASLDFELDCSLTDEDALDCTLDKVSLDGESDNDGYFSTWHLIFEKSE